MQSQLTNLIKQAQQGNAHAIAKLLDRALEPNQISTKVSRLQHKLTIFADGQFVPDKESLVAIIQHGIKDLGIEGIESVTVYGRKAGVPLSGWSEELFLKPKFAATSKEKLGKNKADCITPSKLTIQAVEVVKRWIKAARKIRVSKRVAIGSVSFALLAILAFGAVLGTNLFQSRLAQAKTINQAQALVKEIDTSEKANVATLTTAVDKLRQARDLLRSIPDTPGSRYSQAQEELEKVRSQLTALEQRLVAEETASQNWKTANELAQSAIASTNTPPYSLEVWRTAKSNLDTAVQRLEEIPATASIASQVKTKITDYRQRSTVIAQAMAAEQKAVQALQMADTMAQQAMAVTSGGYRFEIADLQQAQTQWQNAINQLKTVPSTSNAFQGVNSRLNIYTSNSSKIADGVKEIQSCLARSSLFPEFCDRVYLNLDSLPPPIE